MNATTAVEGGPAGSVCSRPAPVVLVIGDFRHPETFASAAWKRICSEIALRPATSSCRVNFVEPPTMGNVHATVVAQDSSNHVGLVPVPFNDQGDAGRPEMQRELYEYLCTLDVWAVISCGTAQNTTAVLEHLWPLTIPVLVVVDSTVTPKRTRCGRHDLQHGVIRLMPNNELQAQAIVARVASLAEHHGSTGAQVLCQHGDDEYVRDLREALEEQVSGGPGRPRLHFRHSASLLAPSDDGILVYVGYFEGLRALLSSNRRWRYVIVSDGCYERRTQTLIAGRGDTTEYYWSRPAFDYSEYAWDALRAVEWVRRKILESSRPIHIVQRLPSLCSMLRRRLQRDRSSHYQFRGKDNQRGGYLLENIRVAPFAPVLSAREPVQSSGM